MQIVPHDMTGSPVQGIQIPVKQPDTNSSAQQTPTVEGPNSKLEANVSDKVLAQIRKERAIYAEKKRITEARKSLEAERQALDAIKQENEQVKAWKQKLTQDPYSVMLESGLTADQVATLMLNQPNPADQRVLMLEKQIAELKAAQEQSNSKFDEVQTRQYEEAKKQIRNDTKLLVDGDQNFETIKAMNAEDAVVELIAQTFDQTGNLLSVEEAAKEVEDYLVEEALKFARLKKIQSRLTPVPQTQTQKQPLSQKQNTTLSNRITMTAQTKPLTASERRERAILAFQNKLNI